MTSHTPSIAEVEARLRDYHEWARGPEAEVLGDALALLAAVRPLLDALRDGDHISESVHGFPLITVSDVASLDALLAPLPGDERLTVEGGWA